MRFFKIKASFFQAAKHRFDLPPNLIFFNRIFVFFFARHNQIFSFAIFALFHTTDINLQPEYFDFYFSAQFDLFIDIFPHLQETFPRRFMTGFQTDMKIYLVV